MSIKAKDLLPHSEDSISSEGMKAFLAAIRTLYLGGNIDDVIASVMEYAGKYTNSARVYILEEQIDGHLSYSYEWRAKGIVSAKAAWNNELLGNAFLKTYNTMRNKKEFIIPDIRYLPPAEYNVLSRFGVKAVAILALDIEMKRIGCIGFDDCQNTREWSGADLLMLHDIAEILAILYREKNKQEVHSEHEGMLNLIANNPNTPIAVYDFNNKKPLFFSKAYADILGLEDADAAHETRICHELFRKNIHGDCSHCPFKFLGQQGNGKKVTTHSWESENTNTGKWFLIKDSLIQWTDGRDVVVETVVDVTRQKVYEAQLYSIATKDSMTDTYNREWGQRLIKGFMERSRSAHCLTFIDIDGLKHVNDTYGHKIGDEYILTTVDLIKKSIRKGDHLCRWGGDEFLLITFGGMESATILLNRIKQRLQQFNETKTLPFNMDFSYGIAEINRNKNSSYDDVIKCADERMYMNKLAKRQS